MNPICNTLWFSRNLFKAAFHFDGEYFSTVFSLPLCIKSHDVSTSKQKYIKEV